MKFMTIFLLLLTSLAFAQTETPSNDSGLKSERIDVEKIKERYWNKNEEGELRIVQNRTYTKNGKIQLGIFAGSVSTDPFLKVYNYGAELGYNFTEYLSFNVIGWKFHVKPSSASDDFKKQNGGTTNTNEPKLFFGGEFEFSPIYGKLSVLGKSIIYYDLHLLGGAGLTDSESGTYKTPLLGIGQQVFIAKNLVVRLDYRATYYRENVLQKFDAAKLHSVVGTRNTYNSIVSLGMVFFY